MPVLTLSCICRQSFLQHFYSFLGCFICIYFCLLEKTFPTAAERVLAGALGSRPLGLSLLLDGQQTPQLLQLRQPNSRLAVAPHQDVNLLLPAGRQLLAPPLPGHAEL